MEAALEPADAAAGEPHGPPAISLRSLRRDYGDFPVLGEVDLDLPAGETLVVLGPNGAGKSTLLRILATLLRASAGSAEVLGAELPRQAWKARGRIGYLGHEPLLYRELSIRENLAFNARLHRISEPAARIDELIGRAGLTRRGGELVRNLSAGMLQRASVCRALLHRPELLLLDEPRSHLDVAGAAIVDAMLNLTPAQTRVIVTHEVERGLEQADRVLALRADGTVAASAPAGDFDVAEARSIFGDEVR